MKRSSLAMSIAAASIVALGLTGASAATPHTGHAMPVPVDRQDYVTAVSTTNPVDGTRIDEYDADPSVIHVAMNGGQENARSFVHLALDYLPAHASGSQATLTLHVPQQADASNTGVYPIYNVNVSSAIVEACALTSELPAAFDPSKPPAYDCAHGSAVGVLDKAQDAMTFRLANLVAYWKLHGNTGAALVPIAADAGSTWQIAFSKSRSTAVVDYTLTAPKRPHPGGGAAVATTGSHPASTGTGTGGRPTSGSGGGSGSAPAPPTNAVAPPSSAGTGVTPPAQSPAVAGSSTVPAAAPAARRAGSAGTPAWPWVLLASLAVAAGAIGFAHRAGVRRLVMRIVPPGLAAFRAHPRAYSVAAAAAAWGLVFTGYSVVTTTPHRAPLALGGTQADAAQPAAAGPTASTAPGLASTAVGATTSTGTAAVTTSGTTTGAAAVAAPTATSAPAQAAASEFSGRGTYRTINGIPVFFPSNGGPPVAKLYTGADDVIGITPKTIKLCAHAALTYGKAFNIEAKDLNVYWEYLNAHGGIFGRSVDGIYENDNYDPGTAVQAAQTCKDWGTFILLGGIGFDQIPAVRQWAEQNHELYLHHIATIQGSQGLRYSFSSQPTVEQVGTWFGQLAAQRFRGEKVGVIYRQSANWQPGVDTFLKAVHAAGMQVVGSYGTTINQGNYTQEIAQLHTAGAQVVFAWENALAETEMIKQAQGQDYHPSWLVFPFNLETQTLGASSMDQQIWGVATWDAYDPGYYGGGFSSYAGDIKEFEREYKQYDPQANLAGDGGDLLFLNWEEQKQIAALLTACGPGCTRNKIAGLLLAGWHKPVPPNCDVNFNRTGDHHHGGYLFNVFHVVRDPNGRPNFVPVNRCIGNL